MSRQRKQAYRSSALSDLTRQLLYSPPEKRAEVVRRAERLHDELEESKNYPIDFVVYRLTDRRVPPSENVMLVGEAVGPDLRLLIDKLSRSIELTCDEGDPGRTTAELARELGVSTKTIGRWRDAGLRWRWGVRELGGKPRVLVMRSALQAFEARQQGRVTAAASFTRLSETEKSRLIKRARRLASAVDAPPQAILAHLSKRSGRSVETLRLLFQQHDQTLPDEPVFADRAGPLSDRQRRVIDRAYQRGITVSALCQRFGKTRSTIYRAIHEGRARRACAMPITVVDSPTFDRDDADEVLMQPITRQGKRRRLDRNAIGVLPDALKPIYDRPIEPDDVVRSLIVRYNFIKHRAARLQQTIREEAPRARNLDQYDELLARARQARGEVLAAVLPVVLSVVRRQLPATAQAGEATLLAMLGVANEVLLEQVDRFDAAIAHTFESVLTNRLLRVLAQPIGPGDANDADQLVDRLLRAGFVPGETGEDR